MKKLFLMLLVPVLLTGCKAAQTFETMDDVLIQPVMEQSGEIVLTLPGSASLEVIESEEGGRLYLCDGYTLTTQTLTGGDMNRTIQSLCGYGPESLTVMNRHDGELKRHEWIWICAGEGGEQLGRAVVLDDGKFHYCVTAMADAADAAALEPEWNGIFDSFEIG
ncbi:MAG: hypothetical protein E7466_07665 [Ruminococcaceae bacterium]|nr:hypothetical protein [Oscillospiraceae bacterium]MBQ3215247.1 hypothetical protein [Oscillospiraceae bacterium]